LSSDTGHAVREIGSSGRDIHNDIEISKNNAVLLAYVGKEKWGFSLRAMEYVQEIIDERFELFDFRTGKTLGISPDLGASGISCNTVPSFRLAKEGNRALVYWKSACPPMVVEIF
jgi:hypothetical protein